MRLGPAHEEPQCHSTVAVAAAAAARAAVTSSHPRLSPSGQNHCPKLPTERGHATEARNGAREKWSESEAYVLSVAVRNGPNRSEAYVLHVFKTSFGYNAQWSESEAYVIIGTLFDIIRIGP